MDMKMTFILEYEKVNMKDFQGNKLFQQLLKQLLEEQYSFNVNRSFLRIVNYEIQH